MTMIEEMEALVSLFDEEPERVWREAQEDQLHATMDEMERPS